MRRIFLSGILCGVMLASAVTFVLAIPANNDHWRVEITKHGGGDWSIDKEGNLHWMWTAQPIFERGYPHPLPPPRRASNSSLQRL